MIQEILIKLIHTTILGTTYAPSRFIMHPRIERALRYELSGFAGIEYSQTKKFMGILIETDDTEKNIRSIV